MAPPQPAPMRIRVGTSGYSFPAWRGRFYPEGLAPEAMLAFYATRFDCVEINNTFYRLPKRDVLARWADEVQGREGFTFVLKASQRITHQKRLAGAESELAFLLGNLSALGPTLGPLLFQLPPFLRRDAERLRAFLRLIPAGQRVAFEFRHASWEHDETTGVLREAGAALALAEDDDAPAPHPLPVTSDWGYVRLRKSPYDDDALRAWIARLQAMPWRETFVFFKHEDDDPQGPAAALRFADLAGRA